MRGRLTRGNRQKIEDALSNHEKLRHSYLWNGDHGNGQQRSREEQEKSFTIRFQYAGEKYTYVSNVNISRKNFYYKGSFWLNDEKRDARLFKSLLKKADEAIRQALKDPVRNDSADDDWWDGSEEQKRSSEAWDDHFTRI